MNSQNKNHFSLGQSHYKALIDVLLLLKIWTFWHVNRLIKRKRYTVTKKRIINYRLEDTDNKWRLFLNGVLLSFLSKCRSLMRTWVFDTFLVSKATIFVDIVKKERKHRNHHSRLLKSSPIYLKNKLNSLYFKLHFIAFKGRYLQKVYYSRK